jgi:hypothetical protein
MARTATQPILRKVNRLIDTIPEDRLTASVEIQCEMARNIARRLDGATESGAVAQAIPSMMRTLQELIERLLQVTPERDDFLDHLFMDDDGIDVRVQLTRKGQTT